MNKKMNVRKPGTMLFINSIFLYQSKTEHFSIIQLSKLGSYLAITENPTNRTCILFKEGTQIVKYLRYI